MMKSIAFALTCLFASTALAATVDLYGPEPRYNHAYEYNQMSWGWSGAYTPHTEWVRFDLIEPAKSVYLVWVVWPLNRCYIDLAHADDGPTNVTTIVQLTHPNATAPKIIRSDITSQWNALVAAGVPKHIGFRLHGHCVVSQVRLQIVE